MALTTQKIRVVLDDDREYTVRVLNVDMVAYDRERTQHKNWPSMFDGPVFYQTWIAWHALTRLNLIPKWAYAEFETKAWQIEPLDADSPEEVDPTQPAAEPE
jgi:hypothetical protein